MWAYGCHYRIHNLDEWRHSCDSGITCRFQEGGNDVDYIGLLEEILEMDYRNLKDQSSKLVVFKVQWFRSIVEYDECMFYAINSTQVH